MTNARRALAWGLLAGTLALLAPVSAPGQVVIRCGPGLGNCSDTGAPPQMRAQFAWERTDPGVYRLVATDITVEWDPQTDMWTVKWGKYSRSAGLTRADALEAGIRWAIDLADNGFTP